MSRARLRSARSSTHSRAFIRCCAGPSATTSPDSAGHSCGSSPASRTCPLSLRTHRCPTRSRRGRSPFLLWGPLRAGNLAGREHPFSGAILTAALALTYLPSTTGRLIASLLSSGRRSGLVVIPTSNQRCGWLRALCARRDRPTMQACRRLTEKLTMFGVSPSARTGFCGS
jgi:hypothetical protein